MKEREDEDIHGVKTSHALNALRAEGLIKREYVERQSWYEITEDGSKYLRKREATQQISTSDPSSFVNCDVVLSSNGNSDASVYWSRPIDPFTRKLIGNIIERCPGIKILAHEQE